MLDGPSILNPESQANLMRAPCRLTGLESRTWPFEGTEVPGQGAEVERIWKKSRFHRQTETVS